MILLASMVKRPTSSKKTCNEKQQPLSHLSLFIPHLVSMFFLWFMSIFLNNIFVLQVGSSLVVIICCLSVKRGEDSALLYPPVFESCRDGVKLMIQSVHLYYDHKYYSQLRWVRCLVNCVCTSFLVWLFFRSFPHVCVSFFSLLCGETHQRIYHFQYFSGALCSLIPLGLCAPRSYHRISPH